MSCRPSINEARSKIVATVGPACDTTDKLVELIEHGVDVFRINSAHGSQADFERVLATVREARKITEYPAAVLLDLSGPKIRLGQLAEDPFDVEHGMEIEIVRGETAEPGQLCCNYGKLIDEV